MDISLALTMERDTWNEPHLMKIDIIGLHAKRTAYIAFEVQCRDLSANASSCGSISAAASAST